MANIQSKEILIVPIKEIKLNPKNRNKHPKEQIDRLVKIIEYQGFRTPVTVSKRTGLLVAGHGRIMAAKKLGYKEVPAIFQDFDSEEQEIAHGISDNAIALWSELDMDGINVDLEQFAKDFDKSLLGIKNLELEKLPEEPGCDEDEVPEKVEPKAKLGDIYQLGNHRLMCGDSTSIDAVEKLMNGEKADMVFTDPPYGDNHAMSDMVPMSERTKGKSIVSGVRTIKNDDNIDFLKEVANCSSVFLKEKFSAFVFFKWNKWEKIKEFFTSYGEPKTVCVWDRDSQGASTFRINPVHEFCFYWGTLGDKKETGNLRNVWRCRKERNSAEMHPTVKPIEIIEMPIRMCCDVGGVVLDLFGGSGSTLIACEKTNRKCYMMELDPHYTSIIIERWCKYTGKEAYLINEDGTQTPWSEVKAVEQ